VQPVRDLVRQLDPRVPILEIGSLDEINERSFGPQLWLARAAGVLGAMLLASGIPALRASRVDPVANLKDG
jgi:ABC-type lipoprotein release transport system permease subunit